MKHIFRSCIFIFFLITQAYSLGNSSIWIEPVGGKPDEKYYVGQKVNLQVRLNTYGEKITGVCLYLTLDTKYLRIVPQDDGKPFRRGNFFQRNTEDNDYNGDTPENPLANGREGLQMDYFQQTSPAQGGVRPYKSGSGILAYFDVIVVGIPQTEGNEYVIDFDDDFINVRQTGYYIHGRPGERQNFNHMIPFVMNIFGSAIEPPLPDTVIVPGETLNYYLGDHFYAEEFEKSDAIWSFEIIQDVEGVTVSLDTTDNRDMIDIVTVQGTKGLLILRMTMGIEGSSFKTQQLWHIAIGYPPKFVDPLPEIEILEDVESPVSISSLIIDEDDSVNDLHIRLKSDSLVNFHRDDGFFYLLSKENWFGETSVDLFVTDSMSPEIGRNIPITVLPVNDAPVIDFTPSELIIGDTLVLHHDEQKAINLTPLVSDVDDSVFTWTYSEDVNLDISIRNDSLIIAVAPEGAAFYGNIPVTLTVYDDEILGTSKVLNVLVKSYAPEIAYISPILMHADSTRQIELDDYVSDNDTPNENLTFEFSAIDSTTKETDYNITTSFHATNRVLSISATSGHNADDYLVVKVTDDDGNHSTRRVILIVVDSYAPKFLKIPPVIVYQDSTKDINLNDYVFDVRDSSEDLVLEVTGNDIFQQVILNDDNHILTFHSYADVFGADTLKLVAENTYGLKDSTDLIAYCIPRDNKPVIFDISDLDLFWRAEYAWIDFDNFVFDAFTPDSELVWQITHSDDLFDLNIDENNFATIVTTDRVGTGKVNIQVTNNLGHTSVKEVLVTVSQDQKPVWDSFKDIFLVKTQPVRTMEWNIFNKCQDGETASENLKYSAAYESDIIDVDIDAVTGEVVFTVLDTSEEQTWVKFKAEDENANLAESHLIDVFIGEGLPPAWRTIPTIYIKNTEVFEDLRLLDYCQDTDDPEEDLQFSAIASNSNIEVEILAGSYVRITPKNGIHGENYYIIFKVEDTQNNIVSTSVKLIISDDLPPRGWVNYIVNPVLSTRVDFVVSTDETVRELAANFKRLPSTSISLNFTEMNSNDNGKLWTEDYKFTAEGTYRLIIEMEDVNKILTYDTLAMTVQFPDNQGAQMALGNVTETIYLDYPAYNYQNKMFFITEKKSEKTAGEATQLTAQQDIYHKTYQIQSGIHAGEILMTLRFQPQLAISDYHSFYKMEGDQLVPIETFKNEQGEFIAYISEDCEVCFRPSSKAAQKEIIPENYFVCYPNPFNPTVNMKFILKSAQPVKMDVYNLRGQKVYSEKHNFQPGINEMAWHGIDQRGTPMSSGVYFVLLTKNQNPMKIKKVTLFK